VNSKVDEYIDKCKKWQQEIKTLRSILLDCGLSEELKWRVPCYTFKNANIILIGVFKEYCTLSFFKGVLLKDDNKVLAAPGENSQAVRMLKFTSSKEILKNEALIKAYVFEAIELEKAGLKVDFKEKSELTFPEELQNKLDNSPAFKAAFEALTPGRQRAYNLHFSAPKQSKTRTSRIENCVERILNGKGFNDCICGLTKRPPQCDGSHKYI